MGLWQRFTRWRTERLIRKVVYKSADAMLILADERFREALTNDERTALLARYDKWLCEFIEDDARLLSFIEQPVRAVQLFLSEVIR
jgi:hypothetical protein